MEESEIFKVVAKIYEVKNGQVTGLEYPPDSGRFFDSRLLEKIKSPQGTEFAVEKKSDFVLKAEEVKQPQRYTSRTDKGNLIVKTATISIYENVFNDMKQNIEENNMNIDNRAMRNIIKNYWPNIKRKSVNSYAAIYCTYVKKVLNMSVTKLGSKGKGERLGIVRNTPIFANVVRDIKSGILVGEKYMDLMKRVEKYYPGCTVSTYRTYVNHYKHWVAKGGNQPKPKKERQTYPSRDGIDRGKIIGKIGNMRIYDKILDAYKEAAKTTTEHGVLRKVFREFYPNAKDLSHAVYCSAYRRYRGDEKLSFRKKKSKKRRRRRPKDCIGFSKKYSTWIRKEEKILVKKALYKYGFKATSDAIAAETGLRRCRIMPTLDYLISEKEAYIKLDGKGKRVYRPAI